MALPMAPVSAPPPPAAIGPAATPQQARIIAFGGRD
jgi:hypothetical protein